MDDPQDTIQLPIGIFLEKKQVSGFVTCKADQSMRHACDLMLVWTNIFYSFFDKWACLFKILF